MEIKSGDARPIAILLAVYNGEKYLSEQIDSILDQTNTSWTLYIRNDGSSDGTQRIIDSYLRRFPDRIVQIDRGGANLGCRGNFFRLLETVEADYYMFSDADDVWLPEKVQILFDAIRELERQYPALPCQAFADTIVCDEHLNVLEASHWRGAGINPDRFLSYNYMAVCCTAGGACSIYNRKVKDMIFPLTNDYLIYDFWIAINVAKRGKLKAVHKPLLKYRQHGAQTYGISYGAQNTLSHKLKRIGALVRQYRWEAQHHKDFGYGPKIKYYWYKFMTIVKIRMGRYR